MRWTTNRPTQPGWYWWRNANKAGCIIIRVDGRKKFEAHYPIYGEWAGPLTPPTEPEEAR